MHTRRGRSGRVARTLATTVLLVGVAAWSATLAGCDDPFADCDGCCEGGNCGGGPPPSSVRCIDAPAPTDGVTLILGRREGGDFVAFTEGESVAIDFGGQGGQHFYVDARVFGAPPGATFFARFEATSDRGSFSRSYSGDDCADGWLELDGYVPLDSGSGGEGTLTVQVGTCSESGCAFDDDGNYVPSELHAEATVTLSVGSGT